MLYLYHIILYNPIYNALVFFYNVIPWHDFGISIIILTILLKVLLYPLSAKALKSQRALQDLEPKMKALQAQYKDNKQELAKATMGLYKEEKVSPFSSCLPLLIQFPFLIALYQSMRVALESKGFEVLYPFVSNPGTINAVSFGFLDLSKPNIALAVLAGAAQFLQTKMLPSKRPPKGAGAGAKDEGQMAMMNKQMLYMMPLLTVFIGASIPAGLTLYWFLTTILTIGQQVLVFNRQKKIEPVAEIIKNS
ncbi:YidC/Oxa1 family membrane protein insertase [Candidatus Parcubacteria bacterium]|nr:YidC/Oxa1 family membrane protein insertase [Patescibacteria group bacterium]MCG2694082.1 YidC/Oxa1 family membrane protein insertase [Candidatus Parcubacteria bacterium]